MDFGGNTVLARLTRIIDLRLVRHGLARTDAFAIVLSFTVTWLLRNRIIFREIEAGA